MPKITILLGVLLIMLGLVAYLGLQEAGQPRSITAMIPAFLGLPLVALGAIALKPHLRKHAMHAAVVIGLLGFLGTAKGLIGALRWIMGTAPEHPTRIAVQAITGALCAVFVALCIRSFIAARRARAGGKVPAL
ncbi:MAG: hypothetical protein WBD40_12060 [Tepidisphaeraceae bacterium]